MQSRNRTAPPLWRAAPSLLGFCKTLRFGAGSIPPKRTIMVRGRDMRQADGEPHATQGPRQAHSWGPASDRAAGLQRGAQGCGPRGHRRLPFRPETTTFQGRVNERTRAPFDGSGRFGGLRSGGGVSFGLHPPLVSDGPGRHGGRPWPAAAWSPARRSPTPRPAAATRPQAARRARPLPTRPTPFRPWPKRPPSPRRTKRPTSWSSAAALPA